MKRNKVLLGLFAGLMALAGGTAGAQTSKFYEMGPANIGGDVSSIVVDQRDTTRFTIFAGAATGGVYVRSESSDLLRALYSDADSALASNRQIWHYVPCTRNGKQVVLPVSCMKQIPNDSNFILIGTGSDTYAHGSSYGRMSMSGKGIYILNPHTYEYALVPGTDTDSNFACVRSIEAMAYTEGVDRKIVIYVATSTGLFRWTTPLSSVRSINVSIANRIFSGRVEDFKLVPNFNTAYFTSGSNLYKIGNATARIQDVVPVNISASNTAFSGTNRYIRLAVAPSNSRYLYAMVVENENLENLYLTVDGQNWSALTPSTVSPFTYTSYTNGCALTVDPVNPKRVYIAGTSVWAGEGFVDGSFYQWTKSSNCEYEYYTSSGLVGNYMGGIFSSSDFVHSGIHQIVPVYHIDENGEPYHTYYIATDGGVYITNNDFATFTNINRGLNIVQVNDVAVCPDGSIISAANNNGCPFIESRNAHDGGSTERSWYNDGSISNINQEGNILWKGSGARVAASSFQQLFPQSRRNIFVSSVNGAAARAYTDYFDYTNTTTWTADTCFTAKDGSNSPTGIIGKGGFALWETTNNTLFNGKVRVGIDTLGYILRPSHTPDTMWVNDTAYHANRGSKFQLLPGDTAIFNSRANSDYCFKYVYTQRKLASDSLTIVSPVQSRMLMVGDFSTRPSSSAAFFCWTPNDFTKVWNTAEAESAPDRMNYWVPILIVGRTGLTDEFVSDTNLGARMVFTSANAYVRSVAFSNDGRYAYVSVYDIAKERSALFRVKGFDAIDFSKSQSAIKNQIAWNEKINPIKPEVLKFNDCVWINRPISSISVDPRPGVDRLILTFEDYNAAVGNIAYLNNASSALYQYTFDSVANNKSLPVYCALVEKSTGTVYAGTEKGVYYKDSTNTWNSYDKIGDLPVTSIYQQTNERFVQRNLTHTGITANNYVFAKTKWPYALYFGTYGRGIFMDMQYVTDTTNAVCDSSDYSNVGIPTVNTVGRNSLSLYPNPVSSEAHLTLTSAVAGNAVVYVYDLNGRCVMSRNLGHVGEGEHTFSLGVEGMAKGLYLVNVFVGGHTATAKMMVR